MTELENALDRRNIDDAMDAVPWNKLEEMQHPVGAELQNVLNKSGASAAKALLNQGIEIAFDQTNPNAVNWAKAHAAEMVNLDFMPNTRQAIRDIIVAGFEEGVTPANSARLIRNHIGILPRHAGAVLKYRKAMIDKHGPITGNRLALRYHNRLLNWRANMIARTETIHAANQGQQELWNQAVGSNLLDKAEWEREWIADETKRTCAICKRLHNKRAPLQNGVFEGGYDMPPAHPQCRCSVGLARIK